MLRCECQRAPVLDMCRPESYPVGSTFHLEATNDRRSTLGSSGGAWAPLALVLSSRSTITQIRDPPRERKMAESVHRKLERVRAPRVHIKYDVETGGAIENSDSVTIRRKGHFASQQRGACNSISQKDGDASS